MTPHFIIIGAQKAGTTAAIRNLALHPGIHTFRGVTEYGQKELEFFNQHWERGADWYRSHFPDSEKLIGEKTAELLHRTVCHGRMRLVNPDFKVIVLLRCPIARAYSQWTMAARWKRDEPDAFETVVERGIAETIDPDRRDAFYHCAQTEKTCWRQGYVLKGLYAEQLQSVLQYFPREQIHISVSERVRSDPGTHYAEMFRFLGLPAFVAPFGDHFMSPAVDPMSARARAMLSAFYEEPNCQLFNLLGGEIAEWI